MLSSNVSSQSSTRTSKAPKKGKLRSTTKKSRPNQLQRPRPTPQEIVGGLRSALDYLEEAMYRMMDLIERIDPDGLSKGDLREIENLDGRSYGLSEDLSMLADCIEDDAEA